MKPAYWIGIMALIGAIVGYAVFRWTGWTSPTTGVVVGILIGTILYVMLRDRLKTRS